LIAPLLCHLLGIAPAPGMQPLGEGGGVFFAQ